MWVKTEKHGLRDLEGNCQHLVRGTYVLRTLTPTPTVEITQTSLRQAYGFSEPINMLLQYRKDAKRSMSHIAGKPLFFPRPNVHTGDLVSKYARQDINI